MNLIDAQITKILTEPKLKWGVWEVKVISIAEGRECTTDLIFSTKEGADTVKVGQMILI